MPSAADAQAERTASSVAEAPARAASTDEARSGRSPMLVNATRASLIDPPSALTVAATATIAHWWATRTNFS